VTPDAAEYGFGLELCRTDGTTLKRVPVDPDWEPAREGARLAALRAGLGPEDAFRLDATIEPVWHAERGEPYLETCRVRPVPNGIEPIEVGVRYFAGVAQDAASALVDEGALAKGDLFVYLPIAFPRTAPAEAPPPPRFTTRAGTPRIPLGRGSLAALESGVTARDTQSPAADPPVFVPGEVLDQALALTRAADGRETGGILVGHLHRDPRDHTVFLAVTAQIPARHTEADAHKLSFTAATWTEVRTVLDLRGKDELMLGWWHSHPVREWCKQCPEERQRACSLAQGFLSDHDRLLHRTVFPRAFTVALVVNDVAFAEPTVSAFGWRHGVLEPRGFHTVGPGSAAPAISPASREEPAHAAR
jgi:hypothetical protein